MIISVDGKGWPNMANEPPSASFKQQEGKYRHHHGTQSSWVNSCCGWVYFPDKIGKAKKQR